MRPAQIVENQRVGPDALALDQRLICQDRPFPVLHRQRPIGPNEQIGRPGGRWLRGPRRIAGRGLGLSRRLRMAGERRERSEEHTSELQSLMRISYAVFCLTKKKTRE